MKNTNIKILFLSLVLLSVFGLAATTQAAGNYLYVSPAATTVNAGANLTISAVAGTSGDKICAVQGTIVFNNLTCKSITLANGVMAQTAPTCSSPSFVLGIPKCATVNTTLFTVSSTAGNAGTASISFSGVNLVGVGVSVGTASTGGSYTVKAIVQPKPTTTPETTTQPTTETPTTVTTPTTEQQTNVPQSAALGETPATATFFGWIWKNIIWIVVVIAVLVAVYYIVRRATKKK